MHVDCARLEDIPAWLDLACQVEPLFGPMLEDPGFNRALRKNIDRGTAYCVHEDDGPPGSPLKGGLLFSRKPPEYEIGWLAVAQKWRRNGVGRLLVEHALRFVVTPAEVVVVTFGDSTEAGWPAREFYKELGFQPAELAPPGPDGGSRRIYRRILR